MEMGKDHLLQQIILFEEIRIMKKHPLKENYERFFGKFIREDAYGRRLKEEENAPNIKSGDTVKIYNIYRGIEQSVQAVTDSEFFEDWETYFFTAKFPDIPGEPFVITYSDEGWVLDPTYQE